MLSVQIRQLRKRRGMTLQQLADKVGTSASALHRYENGWDRFEVNTLRRIANALGGHLEIRLVAGEEATSGRPTAPKLVKLLRPLFWDKRLTPDDVESHPTWVLSRVLMFGNSEQVRAARAYFGDDLIRKTIGQRGIDPRTRGYWKLLLGEEDASARAD